MERIGVLIGGNWIIDQVKVIDVYPEEEQLTSIMSERTSNGGSAYNILKDLAMLKADFPLAGVGLVGDDDRGSFIIEECKSLGINIDQVHQLESHSTSYTDVMTVKSTGKRTFFYQKGANAKLNETHFDFSISNAKIFHLGYLLLLDELDELLPDGTTRAAHLFKMAKAQGFLTSTDVVSEKSDRFHEVISPSLPFIDFLFVNEYEAAKLTDVKTVNPNGTVNLENCYSAAIKLIEKGVQSWVILHFPEGAIAVDKQGNRIFQACINLPVDEIAGAVGAGDAFAAGILLGIHNGHDMEYCLKLGICAAASCLLASTSSDGLMPVDDVLMLATRYGFKSFV
ncbi:MAG: hypothetical protein EOO90_13290 [Pedobacter sp.]|nr:MAG: hypothetical protein EOO90_13290 [Pedobacter sp.]